MTANQRRLEKKRKQKEMFDSQYDMKDDSEFYDNWKLEMEQQAKVSVRGVDSMSTILLVFRRYFAALYVMMMHWIEILIHF